MAFSFGLGSDTMLNQYQRDAGEFKLIDMASNIQKYSSAPAPPAGQAPLSAATYVDYTFHHLNRFMDQDQLNDNNATFLLEYQALLRSRIQQMITDLTTALTRDLDKALGQVRDAWNFAGMGDRLSSQGYTSDVEDAGAARVAYNFLTGFANSVVPASGGIGGVPYTGIPTYDSRPNANVNKVSPDTSADAVFGGDDPNTIGTAEAVTVTTYPGNNGNGIYRSFGTAVLQQGFPEDGLTEAVIDNLMVGYTAKPVLSGTLGPEGFNAREVLYNESGGGFIAHKNTYKFTDTSSTDLYDAQGIGFLNTTIGAGSDTGNRNDDDWDTITEASPGDVPYYLFNKSGNVKNEFERVLYDTIFELDQRNLLRDIFRLSENLGLFNDIQIASTSSINTGSQIQASIKLNFIPFRDGVTADNQDVDDDGDTAEAITYRPDLGGRIQVCLDRFSAFYHS